MTMTKLTLTAAATAALLGAIALPAFADTMVTDANDDGVFSMEELMVAYPELNEETFTAADTNADGVVDPDELAAAVTAGLLPA
ncbi:MAG: hypothetical protein ACJA2X_001079 [Halocynthiibacter sp.]|jgi:hypothetical protein